MHALRNRIRQARRLSGVTRSELARRVGVKPSAAVQWEQHGGTAPTVRNLIKIALFTNVSFEWLATGRGSPRSSALPEVDAVMRDDFAQNLFEEQLLRLAREMPPKWHSPLVDFLRAVLGKTG